jgi:ceramide glucosyltransferase
MFLFMRRRLLPESKEEIKYKPLVSLIKPVYGMEKDLHVNLATACGQDYPSYEIVFSVQRKNDPALPVINKIQEDYPDENIQVVIDENSIGPNGKVSNLFNACKRARGDVLVISDSDMFLEKDYLKTIVAPLSREKVGVSCTLYKACKPVNFVEKLELLCFNVDFIPSIVFAVVTKTSIACPGQTHAIRREVLEEMGGMEPLANYLVEDYELGRWAAKAGYDIHFSPHVVNMNVDLKSFRDFWTHQVYWDQNTRSANTPGFLFTLFIRGVPFALIYAVLGGA